MWVLLGSYIHNERFSISQLENIGDSEVGPEYLNTIAPSTTLVPQVVLGV